MSDKCANCGVETTIELLDAKPGPGQWSADDLRKAADEGRDFDRLECRKCYGPNYVQGTPTP